MRKLVYGGTVDPVPNGHLATARAARDQLGCAVRLMPAADPPHRTPPGAEAGQRAAMLDLAIGHETGLRVDRRELARVGRSYTIDTLRELRAEFGPTQPLALLVGADSFLGLPTWREWQALFGLAHFVVAPRPGSALEGELPQPLQREVAGRWADSPAVLRDSAAGRVLTLSQPPQPESASEVRRRIASGQDWQALVPPAVAVFIRAEGLYLKPIGEHSSL